MSDDDQIHRILESLPTSSLTTRLLGALDFIVPGEWTNITSFEAMIREVTGEDDQDLVQRVGERALALYADPEQGYQRAVQIFRLIDDTGGIAGAVSLANKVGEHFEFASFLTEVTPKADTTQVIDASVKLVGELAAFCYTNGIPGDSVGEFASSLAAYAKEDAIRLGAFVACDCLIPLGPDFLGFLVERVRGMTDDLIGENSRFARLAALLPGNSIEEQRELMAKNVEGASSALETFVANRGITRESSAEAIKRALDIADDRLDFVASALDLTTNYFEHTGIQSVCRRLVSRAYGEI